MTQQEQNRYINSNIPKLQENLYNPLSDYENLRLLTLEEAVEKIVPLISRVMDYVTTAKKNYNRHSTLLTCDESAAIYLYTMPNEFVSKLNIVLRDPNRQLLKPWLHFLKLFMTALQKLPPTKATVWRGVNYDATLTFVEGEVYTWWNITSCSMDLKSVQPFLGEDGTLFAIETIHGRNISTFSAVSDEQEVILMPCTRVRVISNSSDFIDRLSIIHLEEIAPRR
jgi:hypothetical protein